MSEASLLCHREGERRFRLEPLKLDELFRPSSSLNESFSPSFCLSSACLVRLSRMSSAVTLSFFCLVRGPQKPNRWCALGDLESEAKFYSPYIVIGLIADLRMRVLVNAGQGHFFFAHVTNVWQGHFYWVPENRRNCRWQPKVYP